MKAQAIALTTILIIISFCILFLSLLLAPDSNSFSGALVGSNDLDLFKVSKERGIKKNNQMVYVCIRYITFCPCYCIKICASKRLI